MAAFGHFPEGEIQEPNHVMKDRKINLEGDT
jgi:hypothetical protein